MGLFHQSTPDHRGNEVRDGGLTMKTYVFKLPDIGEGTAEAEVAAWRVRVGESVTEDQPLVDMMTDKATVEITSPVSGVVTAVHASVGEMTPVGGRLITFALGGALAEAEVETHTVAAALAAPVAQQGSAGSAVSAADTVTMRPIAAPAVRRRARQLGLSLKWVHGSGPRGRILHQDLDAHISESGVSAAAAVVSVSSPEGAVPPVFQQRSGAPFEEVRIVGLRRKIAEKMQLSKRTIPHFSYIEEVDVTELERLREHLNATRAADCPKLTPLPFLIRALVCVLPRFPQINAHFDEATSVVRRYRAIHVGIATQVPGGLMVPVVRDAETLGIWAAAREIARLADAARKSKATLSELSGSTITLTSLGPLGGLAATPVINAPEVAIIGPNRIIERPVFVGERVVARKVMNLSSSFDHRIVDGYDAATFIQKMKELLENPAMLFMDREG
jgi:2-oxoisovalerate dehydrogenase E2 component (dihydrolipoyl transacylase)